MPPGAASSEDGSIELDFVSLLQQQGSPHWQPALLLARVRARSVRWCRRHASGRKLPVVDPDRARELLAAERSRIERALGGRGHEDDGEEADEFDPGNLASDLYQDELDEGLEEDLREQLAAVERAEQRLAAGNYGLSLESGEPRPDERREGPPPPEPTPRGARARARRRRPTAEGESPGAECER